MTEVGTVAGPALPDAGPSGSRRRPARVARAARADDARREARADRRLLGEGGRRGGRAAAGRVRRPSPASTSSPSTGSATSPAPTAPARSTPAERAAWLWAFQRDAGHRHPARHPGHRPRGVPDRAVGLEGGHLPDPARPGAPRSTPSWCTQMGAAIGASMRALGIHQGLAPVLDVVRDPRWGRVEECIAEDPYLVGTIGTSYVRGLQSQGVHATLKHFVGYSASRAGRNFAPVHAGPREVADVLLHPVRDGDPRRRRAVGDALVHRDRRRAGRRRSPAADRSAARRVGLRRHRRRGLLRGRLPAPAAPRRGRPRRRGGPGAGGRGRRRAADRRRVRRTAGRAGPRRRGGRGARRPGGAAGAAPEARAGPARRDVRRRAADRRRPRLARAPRDRPAAGRGVDRAAVQRRHPAAAGPDAGSRSSARTPTGPGRCSAATRSSTTCSSSTPTSSSASTCRPCWTRCGASSAPRSSPASLGCAVDDDDRSGFAEAVAAATAADVAVLVLGDHAGLFGRGTVGEGCDRDDLELPGVQRDLVEAVLATGTPVVLVLVTGRPYAVDWALDRCAAVVQAFFPGEEGSGAIAGVLSGRVNPSGRLPVSMPRSAGAQPYSYLHPRARRGRRGQQPGHHPGGAVRPRPVVHHVRARRISRSPAAVPTDGRCLVVTVRVDQHRAGRGRRRRPALRA